MRNQDKARFTDALQRLDNALNEWDAIVADPASSAPPVEKISSRPVPSETIRQARELLEKVREQLAELG